MINKYLLLSSFIISITNISGSESKNTIFGVQATYSYCNLEEFQSHPQEASLITLYKKLKIIRQSNNPDDIQQQENRLFHELENQYSHQLDQMGSFGSSFLNKILSPTFVLLFCTNNIQRIIQCHISNDCIRSLIPHSLSNQLHQSLSLFNSFIKESNDLPLHDQRMVKNKFVVLLNKLYINKQYPEIFNISKHLSRSRVYDHVIHNLIKQNDFQTIQQLVECGWSLSHNTAQRIIQEKLHGLFPDRDKIASNILMMCKTHTSPTKIFEKKLSNVDDDILICLPTPHHVSPALNTKSVEGITTAGIQAVNLPKQYTFPIKSKMTNDSHDFYLSIEDQVD